MTATHGASGAGAWDGYDLAIERGTGLTTPRWIPGRSVQQGSSAQRPGRFGPVLDRVRRTPSPLVLYARLGGASSSNLGRENDVHTRMRESAHPPSKLSEGERERQARQGARRASDVTTSLPFA